jgi:crotonobetaine/carnitine-CoA ligase
MAVPAYLERWAAERGDDPYVVDVRGDSRTYAQLHENVLRWAGALREVGIGRGENVATMGTTSIPAIECWLGMARLGACDTGVNVLYSGRMLAYVLANCRARVMVARSEHLEVLAAVKDDVPELSTVIVLDADRTADLPSLPYQAIAAGDLLASAAPADLPPPGRHEPACILYTSGTTGPSKGVIVPWGLLTDSHGVWADLTADDVFYSPFPMYHMTGRLTVGHAGIPGGRLVIREAFKTDEFWPDVDRYGCTVTQMIPTMMNWLLDQPPDDADGRHPLRKTITAPVIPRVEEFERRFNMRVRSCFGMTEIGIALSTGTGLGSDRASAGRPRAGYEARVVDENDEEVPAGEVGELIIRSDEPWTLNSGYFGMPDKTAAAWRNGWFHTGDGFRRDATGECWFVDRIKDSLRRRGENVSSFELEAFVNEHPAVAECAAIGVPGEDGEQEIKIVVVLHDDEGLDPQQLADFLAERVPRFMVPRFIDLASSLPKTDATMRVKKEELRRLGNTDRTWDRLAGVTGRVRA